MGENGDGKEISIKIKFDQKNQALSWSVENCSPDMMLMILELAKLDITQKRALQLAMATQQQMAQQMHDAQMEQRVLRG